MALQGPDRLPLCQPATRHSLGRLAQGPRVCQPMRVALCGILLDKILWRYEYPASQGGKGWQTNSMHCSFSAQRWFGTEFVGLSLKKNYEKTTASFHDIIVGFKKMWWIGFSKRATELKTVGTYAKRNMLNILRSSFFSHTRQVPDIYTNPLWHLHKSSQIDQKSLFMLTTCGKARCFVVFIHTL